MDEKTQKRWFSDEHFSTMPARLAQSKQFLTQQGRVLLAMARWANPRTGELWRSEEGLAEDTGIHRDNIGATIRLLLSSGWVIRDSKGRAGRAARYRLTQPQPKGDKPKGINQDAKGIKQDTEGDKPAHPKGINQPTQRG